MGFEVSRQTTVNIEEYKPDRNTIPFAPELIGFIIQEKKLTTYRFGKKYCYLNVGDEVAIQDSESRKIVTKARITGKSEILFKDLPINVSNHETYRDKEHQRQVLSGYYAYLGRKIADEDLFLVFDFQLL